MQATRLPPCPSISVLSVSPSSPATAAKSQLLKRAVRRCVACVRSDAGPTAARASAAGRRCAPAPFVVRVKGVSGIYTEVALDDGPLTTVGRLAVLACDATPQRGVVLHLVAEGGDLPTPAEEAAAPPVIQIGWTLERAGIRAGAWLVARFAATAVDRRADLERLLIRPTHSVAPSSETLAHVWLSVLAGEADTLRRVLDLPLAFHVHPRNFLILDKSVERAFDADALLLLPVRPSPPEPPTVRARVLRHSEFQSSTACGDAACAGIAALAGRALYLPRAADGKVPFLRLLAWKALSALRAAAFNDE